MDVRFSGPKFGASAVPSLKQFLRDVTKAVPSPKGGTVYEAWQKIDQPGAPSDAGFPRKPSRAAAACPPRRLQAMFRSATWAAAPITAPSCSTSAYPRRDIGSTGPYGVYHSVFDNFAWFKKFGDPDFVYEQQMARVFGLEALRMADADVLPYDYEEYGKEVAATWMRPGERAESKFGDHALDLSAASAAAKHFQEAGARALSKQKNPPRDPSRLEPGAAQC